MYLVRVTPPMNFTFSDDSIFLKKILGGGHKFSEFACYHFFRKLDSSHFSDIFTIKLLLQFYADSFETSQVYWSWSEDMHVVWI